ncbi:MAG: hypothetical protein J6P83_02905 [Bacteroidales bacterium]|nr:hypothetical protein [Bacteroidales bacterium]
MKTKRLMMIAVIFGMAMSVSAQEVSEPKYGTDSVACVTNLSIYGEAYKQWEAAKFAPDAISMEMVNAWREVFLNCPRSSQLIYTRGEKIMDYYIRSNPLQKDAYIDTICMMMDNRAKYFPTDPKTGASQVANIMGRKGLLIYTYNKNRYEEAYNVLKDAVALDPSQLQGAYIDAYFKATIDMVNNNKAEKMAVINVYQELSEVVDNNIEALVEAASQEVSDPMGLTEEELIAAWGTPDNVEESEENGVNTKSLSYGTIVVGIVNGRVENFLDSNNEIGKRFAKNTRNITINKGVKNNLDNLFSPFASCEDLIKVFTAKMAETPDDVTLLKRITTILDKKDCTDSKLFLDAAVRLNELEPSPEASYNLGIKFFKDRKYSEAATFFDQATKTENNDRKYRAYRNLAFCYQNMGSLGRARDIARRAAQVDPTAGEPYLIIAQLYAASASQFTDEVERGAVYCAAVDKCFKAKSIDPSVADRANRLIGSYTAGFPKAETIFFNDFSEGQTIHVGGWIGETTTLRSRK